MCAQHVTFVYPGDLDTRTGGYRYDKRIIEELQSERAGSDPWRVDLVSLDGDYPFPNPTQQEIADAQFDAIADGTLVVVDGLAFSVLPTIMARHARRLNLVALIHHPLALETGLSEEQTKHLELLETQALGYACHVITTSQLTADSLAAYQVPAGKITAVLPGTDTAPLASGSDSDTFNILCVATLTQRKGHKVLFDALSHLHHLPWQLHCAGSTERDPATYQALVTQRQQFKLEERIFFVGEIGDDELEAHYHQADVFVLPSFHEGYGMVLSEAIARGLPVICSDAGAMPDTVPDGAGILVPPGDVSSWSEALSTFMSDNTQRHQLRQAAVQARQHLRSWQQAVEEFSSVLEHAAQQVSESPRQ